MKALEIKNLSKNFGKNQILRNISFDVKEGEIVAVLGESGCGKSTLLSAIAGFFGIDGGEIWLYGEKIANAKCFAPPKARNVGILFQDYALFPHFSVKDNILFGIAHLPKTEQETRYDELVAMLGLEALHSRYPHEISGGQQQRVALARSLAPRPKMILFDEPFSNLNHTMSVRMRSDIKAILARHKLSAILVTHHREDAFYLADKIVLMERGAIIDIGSPKELYENPKNATSAEFLGAVNVVESAQIKGIKNVAFRKWVEGKKGLIRPKDLRVVESWDLGSESRDFARDLGDSQIIEAKVVENIFYGDYYEIIVCVENLRLSLQLDSAIEASEIILKFG